MKRAKGTAKTVAVCGKGGVGKTLISAAIATVLAEEEGLRVLAVDADPSSGLSSALGIRVKKTIDDIRNDLIEMAGGGLMGSREEAAAHLDYEVSDALEERGRLALLAIGRPEGEGCFCRVNGMLKEIIGALADSFDYVVIDGEAGIEQINRRVFSSITNLLLVSDLSKRGLYVAESISGVADRAMNCMSVGLALNMVRDGGEISSLLLPEKIPLLGWIPYDDIVRDAGIQEKAFIDVTVCPAYKAIKKISSKIFSI
ncbi:MAG: AAA family ATPase [Bacillota bacterium]